MSIGVSSQAPSDTRSQISDQISDSAPLSRWLTVPWKLVVFFWKYLIGMTLCQSVLGSVLVVGWTYRLMQRSVLKQWWKRSPVGTRRMSFEEFLECSQATREHGHWPNWMIQQNFLRELRSTRAMRTGTLRAVQSVVVALFTSLWSNLKLGVQAIFNTWVLTLPACVLWLFAWYDGWNNSFNKGYEHATVGLLTGLLGVGLFISAMLYVPLAQVRQAAAGSWRAFYQFRFVWRLIRQRWLSCMALAALYSALSLPVTVLKIAPVFFPQGNPALEDATDAEILHILQVYFFWSCAVVLPCYVVLRLTASRIYASALLTSVQNGLVSPDELGSNERQVLSNLDLLYGRVMRNRSVLAQSVAWSAARLRGAIAGLATAVLWFSFVAQIFISAFFNYHPVIEWMNQPLVQLPWFHYIPSHLSESRDAAEADNPEASLPISPTQTDAWSPWALKERSEPFSPLINFAALPLRGGPAHERDPH